MILLEKTITSDYNAGTGKKTMERKFPQQL